MITFEDAEMTNDAELIAIAIESNPGLEYARIESGLTAWLQITRVITMWRNEECYLAGDPPRGTLQGFPPYRYRATESLGNVGAESADQEMKTT